MSYNPTNWVNGETPINDSNLNHIEQGIKDVADLSDEQETKIAEIANNQIPEEYLQQSVDNYIANNQAGLATKTDVNNLDNKLSSEIVEIKQIITDVISYERDITSIGTSIDIPMTITQGTKYRAEILSYSGDNFSWCQGYEVRGDESYTEVQPQFGIGEYIDFVADDNYAKFRFYVRLRQANTIPQRIVVAVYELNENTIYRKIEKLEQAIETSDLLKDKKVGGLGDSWTDNYLDTTVSWIDYLEERTGCVKYNYGASGSRIYGDTTLGEETVQGFYTRAQTMPEDLDVIIVFGGFNDTFIGYTSGYEWGNIEDTVGADTFVGKYKQLIEYLITKYQDKVILSIIPPNNLSDNEASNYNPMGQYIGNVQSIEKSVNEMYGIPYIELAKVSKEFNLMDINISKYRRSNDHFHPLSIGQEAISKYIQKFVESALVN